MESAPPDEGSEERAADPYRGSAEPPRQPVEHIEPVFSRRASLKPVAYPTGPGAPRRRGQVPVPVAYLFLALYGWALWADAPHAGRLVCSQADARCEVDHGWLLVDREPFPSADLLGAKVVRQADPFSFGGDSWTYSVEVVTRGAVRSLGGSSRLLGDDAAQRRAASIERYVANRKGNLDVEVKFWFGFFVNRLLWVIWLAAAIGIPVRRLWIIRRRSKRPLTEGER